MTDNTCSHKICQANMIKISYDQNMGNELEKTKQLVESQKINDDKRKKNNKRQI